MGVHLLSVGLQSIFQENPVGLQSKDLDVFSGMLRPLSVSRGNSAAAAAALLFHPLSSSPLYFHLHLHLYFLLYFPSPLVFHILKSNQFIIKFISFWVIYTYIFQQCMSFFFFIEIVFCLMDDRYSIYRKFYFLNY